MFAGKQLPSHQIKFTVTEAEPEKFTVGMLEGPFRIGAPFQIPLEFQDEFGHLTKPAGSSKPSIEARWVLVGVCGMENGFVDFLAILTEFLHCFQWAGIDLWGHRSEGESAADQEYPGNRPAALQRWQGIQYLTQSEQGTRSSCVIPCEPPWFSAWNRINTKEVMENASYVKNK